MNKENKIKITPAKGRPMLHWVGKKPLDYVKGFPAQLVEVFDPLNTGDIIETSTFDILYRSFYMHVYFLVSHMELSACKICAKLSPNHSLCPATWLSWCSKLQIGIFVCLAREAKLQVQLQNCR